MSEIRNVFIQLIEKPARKVILKRGIKGMTTGAIVTKLAVMYGAF